MKTYCVTTHTSVNQHLLHSTMKESFESTSLDEAMEIYDNEVEQLRREYKTIEQLDYSPSDKEQNHAVYCSIIAIDSEDADEVEFIKDSEYFYE